MKLNSLGDLAWVRTMGGINHDFVLDMALHSSGGIYLAGNYEGPADFNPDPVAAFTLTPSGISDIFVLKLTQCFPSASSLTAIAPNLDHLRQLYRWRSRIGCRSGLNT